MYLARYMAPFGIVLTCLPRGLLKGGGRPRPAILGEECGNDQARVSFTPRVVHTACRSHRVHTGINSGATHMNSAEADWIRMAICLLGWAWQR